MEKNDKARAVLVYQILRDESGEENRLSLKDIIGKIEKKGISAERRAVTRDIAMLREKGICRVCDDLDWRTKRYWFEERDPLTDTEMNIISRISVSGREELRKDHRKNRPSCRQKSTAGNGKTARGVQQNKAQKPVNAPEYDGHKQRDLK